MSKVRELFISKTSEEIRTELKLPDDGRDWTINWAKDDLQNNSPLIMKIMYRPFDERYTFYTGKSKDFVAYPRAEILKHLNKKENISLITCRQQSSFDFQHSFVSRLLSDMCNISSQTKETGYISPLYTYPDQQTDGIFTKQERTPNLNIVIVEQISTKLGITFTPEKDFSKNSSPPFKEEYPKGEEVKNAPDQSLNNLPHIKPSGENYATT